MTELDLTAIQPSPTNPRRHFDSVKLQELAASIAKVGVLQPVLVRERRRFTVEQDTDSEPPKWDVVNTHAKTMAERYVDEYTNEADAIAAAMRLDEKAGISGYELVAGERRWRAAQLAGLEKIPVTVRELTDLEVAEIQAIENDQREDVLPSERAAGYQNLIKLGRTVEEVAAKVGKSESWLRSILRLNQLDEDCLDAVDGGKIPQATAQLIARVPGDQARKTVALCVLQGVRYPGGLNARGKVADEPLSYRDTKELIQRCFCRELKGAPFSTKAKDLNETVPCEDCPKRAGNAGEEYKDVRGDTCLDPECFRKKAEHNMKREQSNAESKGFVLLTKEQHEECFEGGRYFHSRVFWRLDEPCYDTGLGDARGKKLRDLLKPHLKTLTKYLTHGPDFERYELVKRSDVLPLLSTNKKAQEHKEEQAEQREANAHERAVRLALLEAAHEKAAKMLAYVGDQQGHIADLMEALLVEVLDSSWGESRELVYARHECKGKTVTERIEAFWEKQEDENAGKLFGLLVELLVARNVCGYDKDCGILEALRIDRKEIEKEVKAEKKPSKPKKAGAKG